MIRTISAHLRTVLSNRRRPEPAIGDRRPPRPLARPWRVGTLLVDRDSEGSPYANRMLVGYTPEGHCLTVYVSPPPWLKPAEASRIYRGSADLLRAA